MRVAIFHDCMTSIGGAEKVVFCLAKTFDADVITTCFNPDVLKLADAEHVRVIDIGSVTDFWIVHQVQTCLLFAGADFDNYDFYLFSGNWSCCAGKSHQPNIYLCQQPVRMFYDLKERQINSIRPRGRMVVRTWIKVHTMWDQTAVSRMNLIATNSENVRQRIRKYYGRESVKVYAPVATSRFRFDEIGDYWLAVNRFFPEKRIDLQLEIFRRLPQEKLLIVGDTESEEGPRRYVSQLNVPPNVKLTGAVDQKTLEDLYARCKGFITAAIDEDFGLTPIEAMASGKAVLATDEGGYRETVVDGETGWLLPADVNAFAEKIKSLKEEDLEAMKDKCISRAKMFDDSKFVERIRALITLVQENPGKTY